MGYSSLTKKLPVGIESFEEIKREDFYYVDKTGVIKELLEKCEYSCAVTPQVRQTGKRLSGLAGTAYASLLA